jgi:predicted ribosomally synthesized peptide with nif11-like leader
MSTKEADRFIECTSNDKEFQAKIEKIGNDSNAVYELIKSEGFDCTPDEIKDAFLTAYSSELTPEQLKTVTAGLSDKQGLAIGIGGGVAAIAVGVGIASAAIAAGAV